MDEVQENNIDEKKIEEVLSGQRSHTDLTDAELDIAAERQLEARLAEEQGDTTTIEEPPQQEATTEEAPVEEKPEEEEENKIIPLNKDERLREAQKEKNRIEQLLRDREDRINKVKQDPSLAKKLLGVDIITKQEEIDSEKLWTDEYISQIGELKKEVIDLREWREQREKREQELEAENLRKQEQLEVYSEINNLQSEFPQLKTSESFQKIDKKITAWQQEALSHNVDVDRYFSDSSYRAKADAQGHKLKVSEKDMKTAEEIYSIYSKYKAEKEEGYKTSLTRVFKDSPIYERLEKAPSLSDDDALSRKLRERAQEPQIMSPSSNNAQPSEATLKAAILEQQALSLKTSTTPEDEKRWNELTKIIASYQ